MKSTNKTMTIVDKNQEIVTEQISEAMEFNEVVVYNEMADQTAVRLNLVEQIHAQLNQLDVMIQRREFVMKEIFHHLGE